MTTLIDLDAYYQCDLLRGDDFGSRRLTGWIERRAAKVGAHVEVKGEEGVWLVTAVYSPPRAFAELKEKQLRDRSGLKSIKGKA